VLDAIKNFPWAYQNQGPVLAAFADYVLGGRDSSWHSYQRVGIEDFTPRQLGYSLEHGQFHLQLLKQHLTQRLSNLDRREAITLALDDTLIDRYGDHVYGAARQFDHTRGGSRYANVLVDCWISSPSYLNYDFQTYLPRDYLEQAYGSASDLQTKITLGSQLVTQHLTVLLVQGVRAERLWVTSDSWYASRELVTPCRELGVNFLLNVKKNARAYLFGDKVRLDDLFAANPEDSAWHYRTHPRTGKRVHFQAKTLHMTTLGRCKVLAIRRGSENRSGTTSATGCTYSWLPFLNAGGIIGGWNSCMMA